MGVTHKFDTVLVIAQIMRAYLLLNDAEEKPPITKATLKLALALIGRESGQQKGKWQLPEHQSRRRLKSAGIDPKTFQIVDKRAAAWAWYQLRTTRKYREGVQRELMNSEEEPPDINIPLVFADQDSIKKQKEIDNIQNPQLKPFTTLDKRLNGLFDD